MTPLRKLAVVILAAGRGTRMKSELPKAMQTICGRPMLGLLIEASKTLKPARTIVVAGYRIDLVRDAFKKEAEIIEQRDLLGSGHAVLQAERALSAFRGDVMVLYCDTPLLSPDTLRRLVALRRNTRCAAALLTVELENPSGYGRVERSARGSVARIIEDSDADQAQKKIREINVGCYVFDRDKLFDALRRVRRNAVKGEYYLTDAVGILAEEDDVQAVQTQDIYEAAGINSRRELGRIEGIMQEKILNHWLDKGVRIRDPRTTVIDAGVLIGEGSVVEPNTVIEEGSVIGKKCQIGPFARIRGNSRIGDGCVIGNFVEIVRSRIGRNTQIKHLSYIGDATVGASVNIGAGTITANFDGKKKHQTVIKDNAQLGSGTILIAPVTVGRAAKTGAGAVVTKKSNIPDRGLVVGVPARKL